MIYTGELSKIIIVSFLQMIERVLNCQIFKSVKVIVLIVFVFALMLRLYDAGHLNNDINDLNARHAIMTLDNIRGQYHFFNGPWLLEYDESGFSWFMVPWIILFGHRWIVFRVLAAVLTSLVPAFMTGFAIRTWNRSTGLAAGIIMATIPVQMIWDRNYVMASVAMTSIAWIGSFHLLARSRYISDADSLKAGVLIGLSCYVVHYNSLVLPVLLLLIIQARFRNKTAWMDTFRQIAVVMVSYFAVTVPIFLHKLKNPEYLTWRKRHLISFEPDFHEVFLTYIHNLKVQFSDLVIGNGRYIFIRDGVSVLSPFLAVLILAGIVYVVFHNRRHFITLMIMPSMLFFSNGILKAEDWKGMYYIYYLPFFSLIAALGLRQAGSWLATYLKKKQCFHVSVVLLVAITSFHLWQFFYGPYRIHPRPDFLTHLQCDMMKAPDYPYVFSSRLPEVMHYHLPFWFVTRGDQYRVSIVSWDDQGWLTEPDKLPIKFQNRNDRTVIFAIKEDDLEIFQEQIGVDQVESWEKQKCSGVIFVKCHVNIPEELKRTWTDSLVPPILEMRNSR